MVHSPHVKLTRKHFIEVFLNERVVVRTSHGIADGEMMRFPGTWGIPGGAGCNPSQ